MKTLIVRFAPDGKPQLRQVPDSALLTGGRPLFLGENDTEATFSVMTAVRISRLGLAISRLFAARYYDAATLVALRIPAVGATPSETDLVADSALTVGAWMPVPEDRIWNIECPDGTATRWQVADNFERAIEAVSERSTFKTGDILALADFSTCFTAPRDSRPEWALNSATTLHFKIK